MTLPPIEDDSRGVLRPEPGLANFDHERREPPAALRPFVEWLWSVTWDLPDGERHAQELVPRLSVNLSIWHDGEGLINGPVRRRTERLLDGRGQVVAALFTPAGFRPFVGGSMRRFADQIVPAVDELGEAATRWERADKAAGGHLDDRFAALVDLLVALQPEPDDATALVDDAVRRVQADPSITRVDQLATATGVGVRQLQRLFAEHIGVGPKLVIQRDRLQEAAERVAHGEDVRWADVAAELGFADQAHLTRAFTATIGMPPERYARECRTDR